MLKDRFNSHPERHEGVNWQKVEAKLRADSKALESIIWMEQTGGEPDVIAAEAFQQNDSAEFAAVVDAKIEAGADAEPESQSKKNSSFIFVDCCAETPKFRRALCYDRAAWEKRKSNKPADDAISVAGRESVQMLSEEEYRALQTVGEFDLATSTWVLTPQDVRENGGALFCDKRFGRVFTYHNGAESYYSSRGFRAKVVL